MKSFISGYKNTGMCYQTLSITLEKDSVLAFDDFLALCTDISSAVETVDTMNPNNIYDFEKIELDMDAITADNPVYAITGDIYFVSEKDMKTYYAFTVSIDSDDESDLIDAIQDNLLLIYDVNDVDKLPKILVTSATFSITVTEGEDTEPDEEVTQEVGG